jgi:hypothetical protein
LTAPHSTTKIVCDSIVIVIIMVVIIVT